MTHPAGKDPDETHQRAIHATIASARLSGIEAETADRQLMQRVSRGEITTEQAVALAVKRG